ncbi:nucleotide sugar dehydrogenase, partial [Rhizobiaceae bacterium]|nr:nucleotide sugar dehydrogenase [Rhizobiaceae bacterium]
RIVIGVETPAAEATLRALYRPLYLNKTPIVAFDRRTAELTKYAANAFLATKVAFINEISDLCEAVGANVQDVAQGIGLDNRIGGKFLNAGPGYGGSCFPKDTLALVQTGRDAEVPLSIVEAVVASNSGRKTGLADRVIEAAGGSVAGKTIALLGLAFKPNTDDMRDAPSLDLVPALQAAGATVRAFDPEAMKNAAQLLSDVQYTKNADECLAGADLAILLTEWNLFRALDLKRMSETLADATLIDFRNVYTADEAEAAGLKYVSIGRGSKSA